MNPARFRFAVCCFVFVPVFAAERTLTIRTDDGLALSLGRDGRASAREVDGRSIPLVSQPALFHWRDAVAKSGFLLVNAVGISAPGRVVLQSRDEPLDLRLTASISSHAGYLQIDGEIAARESDDWCIDVKVSLPVNTTGFVAVTGLFDGRSPNNRKNFSNSGHPPPH